MAKKNVNTNLVVVLLVLVGLLGYVLLAQAGNLEPSAAPAPTMKTLQEVYDAASGGINEREGFCQYFETPPDSNQVILTVPAGKRFVLLKLHTSFSANKTEPYWSLTINDNLFIDGAITISGLDGAGDTKKATHNFPDRCVVVNAGDTLKFVNEGSSYMASTTIIGYYYDVQ